VHDSVEERAQVVVTFVELTAWRSLSSKLRNWAETQARPIARRVADLNILR
jgi:hypothetical protein